MALTSRSSGENVNTEDVLKRVCEEFMEMAIPVGAALVQYFETLSNTICEVTKLVEDGDMEIAGNPNKNI